MRKNIKKEVVDLYIDYLSKSGFSKDSASLYVHSCLKKGDDVMRRIFLFGEYFWEKLNFDSVYIYQGCFSDGPKLFGLKELAYEFYKNYVEAPVSSQYFYRKVKSTGFGFCDSLSGEEHSFIIQKVNK